MSIVLKLILGALGVVALIAFASVLSGTVLYFIWPVVAVDVFHLSPLTWWQAVCLTWICGILLKSSQTNNDKD